MFALLLLVANVTNTVSQSNFDNVGAPGAFGAGAVELLELDELLATGCGFTHTVATCATDSQLYVFVAFTNTS